MAMHFRLEYITKHTENEKFTSVGHTAAEGKAFMRDLLFEVPWNDKIH